MRNKYKFREDWSPLVIQEDTLSSLVSDINQLFQGFSPKSVKELLWFMLSKLTNEWNLAT